MNESLINNFNSKVSNRDTIYILGDVVWGHQNYNSVFKRLNGQKHIVLGNHDNKQCYKKLQIDGLVLSVRHMYGITIDGQYIWMCHFPMRSWNRSFHGSWHIYGHCHNTVEDYGLSCDVGVDKWGYRPISFEELKEYFRTRDKFHNTHIRDDYKTYYQRFEQHFTEKYLERISEEENILLKLLEN